MTSTSENNTVLYLYTFYSKNVINGRKGDKEKNNYPIYGLYDFMKKVTTIWDDAKADYPYALWWLSRIHKEQIETEKAINQETLVLRSLIKDDIVISDEDLKFQEHELIKKEKFDTPMKNPYILEQLRLIESFDNHCLLLFKTLELELISKNDFYKKIRLLNKTILSANREVMRYSGIPATFKSVEFNEKEYKDAVELMGELPSDLLQIIETVKHMPAEARKS